VTVSVSRRSLRHGVDCLIYVKVIFNPFGILCIASFYTSVRTGSCFEVHVQVATLVGFTLSQTTKALRESRGIALLYF
jgi:hypothetical protein